MAFSLTPGQLEVEITESTLMENTDATQAILGELSRLGVKLSIDDFGTGFTSLAYLKRFRVDNLKIDSSCVRDIGTDPDDAARGARRMDAGVEQGFYFAAPLPADALKL